MDVICQKIQAEIKKTTKIGEFYNELIIELCKYTSSLNITEQNQNLNKPYYDQIFFQLNKLHDLYETFNESTINDKLAPLMNCNNNINLFWKAKYTINQQNLKKYHPKYESNCIIVHIDIINELFYIYDTAFSLKYDSHFKELNELYSNKSLELIADQIPKLSQVFGIILNNRIYRAIRENTLITNNDTFYNAYLLDYGKIIKISIDHDNIYKLPLNLQNEPSLAICCKLDSIILNNNYSDRKSFFTNSIHKKFYFYVISTEDNDSILNIKLIYKLNPFLDCLNENEYEWLNIDKNENDSLSHESEDNCFVDSLDEDASNLQIAHNNHVQIAHNEQNLKNFLELNNVNNLSINDNNILPNGLTKEENDILMEEPLNTSNALQAVLGYVPKDERLICQFSENGKCFKGSRCKLEHKQIIREGWTRDNAPATIDINMKLVYPKNNTNITITVTHIINVEYFFGQILHENKSYDKTLREMALIMNSDEEIKKYKNFTTDSLPILFELVLAKYTDGFFYRAKIINIDMDNYYKVFYVDYGNCETILLDKIRKWEKKFECIPFQAVSFHLDGIRYIKEQCFEGELYMRNKIVNNVIQAKVINNSSNDILVQLRLNDNCDLSNELIRLGYARKATNYDFKSKGNIQYLPG